ncbi:adrenodoxin oxidoreductase mitochondrial isoform X1 [Gracilaria domingensis]|nr:adrenodoxin oxidoreductase mitochondrial isoform X1 [Gracilaria domingensis]
MPRNTSVHARRASCEKAAAQTLLGVHSFIRNLRHFVSQNPDSSSPPHMRAAVVGAGPAGIYAAQSLLKRFPTCTVDIIEALPVPFGLVRYGVSPDHPATKNVINLFSSFIRTNRHRINFFGNVPVGERHLITSERLTQLYDVSIYATGAAHPRGLPDVSIPSRFVYGAQDFVFWMNGHPYVCDTSVPNSLSTRLESDLKSADRVAVIGVGNVAIDIARLLLRPVQDLCDTDISQSGLQFLSQSPVKSVTLFGRKSPVGASWTTPAIREIVKKIPSIVTACDHSLLRTDFDAAQLSRAKKSMLKVLKENTVDINSAQLHHHEINGSRILRLEFLKSVRSFDAADDHVKLRLSHNQPQSSQAGIQDALDDLEQNFGAAFLSLGYVGGKGPECRVGWANGKGSGIIGDNKWDAETVISALPEPPSQKSQMPGIFNLLQAERVNYVTWEGWETIDTVERERARRHGRNDGRAKLETIEEMLLVANQPARKIMVSK